MLRSAGSVTINVTGAGGNLAYGSFYSSVDQTDGGTGVGMACEVTADSVGVAMNDNGAGKNTRITFTNAGTYNVQFSAQLHNTGGGGSGTTVNIWFKLNGTDIANSNTKCTVNTNNPYYVAAWNFIQTVTAGQYVEIYWVTDNANIVLEAEPITATTPAIPSIIITAQQIR